MCRASFMLFLCISYVPYFPPTRRLVVDDRTNNSATCVNTYTRWAHPCFSVSPPPFPLPRILPYTPLASSTPVYLRVCRAIKIFNSSGSIRLHSRNILKMARPTIMLTLVVDAGSRAGVGAQAVLQLYGMLAAIAVAAAFVTAARDAPERCRTTHE